MSLRELQAEDRKKKIYRVTLIGMLANALLPILKLFAGIFGASTAMIADAIHSFSDLVSDVLLLFFVKLAARPADHDHAYGHGKYEFLASALLSLMLFVASSYILYESAQRLYAFFILDQSFPLPHPIAFFIALVSIIVKEVLYQYTMFVGKQLSSASLIANAWHHRSDAFSSFAVIIGLGAVLLFGRSALFMEPLAALIVSFFLYKVAWDIGKKAWDELSEKSLSTEEEHLILELVAQHPLVRDPHNLRTRRLGYGVAIEVDILVNPELTVLESHRITEEVEKILRNHFGEQTHIVVHIEPDNVKLDDRYERKET